MISQYFSIFQLIFNKISDKINFIQKKKKFHNLINQMSGRLVPYVSKAPQGFEEKIDLALEQKMYLVSEKGPTTFLFIDDQDETLKIQIGLEITCSLCNTKNQQCLHTLFALLKKFRVDKKCPLLWQGSYIDNEIEGLISGKYCEKANNVQKKRYLQANSKFKNKPPKASELPDNRMPIEEDALCPICQDDLKEDQALTFCRKQCGNNFHIKCMIVWVKHKLNGGDEKIPCPMCRTDLGRRCLEDIKQDELKFKAKHETHPNKKCASCTKKPIIGNIYHCLICPNIDICGACFENFNHMQHKHFLTKKNKNDEWKLELENQLLQLEQTQKKPEQKQENNGIEQDLVNCLPKVADFQSQQKKLKQLEIVGFDMGVQNNGVQCSCCNQVNKQAVLRRLTCGHAIDDYCLFQMFMNKKFFCPLDNEPILPGYNSAVNIINAQKQYSNQVQQVNLNKLQNSAKKKQFSDRKNGKNFGKEIERDRFADMGGIIVQSSFGNIQKNYSNQNQMESQLKQIQQQQQDISQGQQLNIQDDQLQFQRYSQIQRNKKLGHDQQQKQNQQNQNQNFQVLSVSSQSNRNQQLEKQIKELDIQLNKAGIGQSNNKNNFRIKKKQGRPPLQQQNKQLDFNLIGGAIQLHNQQIKGNQQISQISGSQVGNRSNSLGRKF
ncbi:hypothetical protein PPERSA_07762 [Pseudocohnilembus persalinus]|uniref:RING-type domain-containing protein n=1 Tax=Pseudocohnilembus persalinus TaxID=266149 RepID=A0A0V0RAE2_PSEPJ|nr:hypothetical protein PPERSA_07762 [Pseudocohnilembus persalinus]|eukprot:KRX11237.1 hypothetical protein PPERSA_07762 [Pseudocohnilembus persalinus]